MANRYLDITISLRDSAMKTLHLEAQLRDQVEHQLGNHGYIYLRNKMYDQLRALWSEQEANLYTKLRRKLAKYEED